VSLSIFGKRSVVFLRKNQRRLRGQALDRHTPLVEVRYNPLEVLGGGRATGRLGGDGGREAATFVSVLHGWFCMIDCTV
jgi:hypothetical protein